MVSPRAEKQSPCLLSAQDALDRAVAQSYPPRKGAGEGDSSLPSADGRITKWKEGGRSRS